MRNRTSLILFFLFVTVFLNALAAKLSQAPDASSNICRSFKANVSEWWSIIPLL